MKRPARIVHVTTVHDPRDTRIQKECRALIDAGYDVTLLATGDAPPGSPVPQVSLPRPKNRRARMTSTARRALRAARELRADVYHFHDPELIPVGLRLRRDGARVIYDVHEDYGGELGHREWIPRPLRRPVAQLAGVAQLLASSHFDRLVVATPTIAASLPRARAVLVQNFPDLDELAPAPGAAFSAREVALAYVGDVRVVRGAVAITDAVAMVDVPGAHLYVGGRIAQPGLREALMASPGAHRTTLMGHLTRREVRDLLGKVRVGLVVLLPTPNHMRAQPTKLYEYMSAGIPVIASNFPLWAETVTGAGCGLLVDPQDRNAIAGAMQTLLADAELAEAMGRRGREAAAREFSWAPEAARLVEAYRELLD